MFDANGDSGTGVTALQREVKSSDPPSTAPNKLDLGSDEVRTEGPILLV
jgi:hypothetical protein